MSNILKPIDLADRAIRRAVFAVFDAAEHRANRKEASGCCGCKSATSTKFASSSEAGHERIADAFACGGDRGAGRVWFLNGASAWEYSHLAEAFRQGLGETGHFESRNVFIEYRWAEGLDLAKHVFQVHGVLSPLPAPLPIRR
jgi:hypothetical protein